MGSMNRTKLFTYEVVSLDSFDLFDLVKGQFYSNDTPSIKWFRDLKIYIWREHIEIINKNKELSFTVMFSSSLNGFGGMPRRWFICPLCLRNARKIYFGKSALACRKCCNLAYASQNETLADRLLRKRNKIRKKLKLSDYGELKKPKWMHVRTFKKLKWAQSEADDLACVSFSFKSRNMKSAIEAAENI